MNQTNPIHTDLMFNKPSSSCSSYIKERRVLKVYEPIMEEEFDSIIKFFTVTKTDVKEKKRVRLKVLNTFALIGKLTEYQLDEIIEKEMSIVNLITYLDGISLEKNKSTAKVKWYK